MPLLELQHLKKYYATQKAVDDISFSIEKGIIFDGARFDPVNDIIKIGYMPEERGLYKKMKIGDQVLYLAQLKGLSKTEAMKKIKFWFQRLEMESWWNKKVEDLSKGMSQKLHFVVTVLHEPKLIILDEPFSGLDPLNANLIKDEIYGLAQRGCTVIFSTHRMEQVEEICDQIVLINLGKKILDGSVQQVKHDFKENIFSIQLSGVPGNIVSNAFEVIDTKVSKLIVKIKDDYKSNDVLQYFIQQNVNIEAFNEILPSLNEIFIKLVESTHATTRPFQKVEA